MSSIPVIGISGCIEHDESKQFIVRDYMAAILAAGAIPLLLSMDMQDDRMGLCLSHLNGVMLAGGTDVAPRLYGALPHNGLGQVDPLRDQFEIRLVNACHRLKMPVLGICRGAQVMNVAMGGTLFQDIASQYPDECQKKPMLHNQTSPGQYASHSVYVDKNSLLYSILKENTIEVNSFHHQAVKDVAVALRICGAAPDGVVEAIDDVSHPFFLGVQWHPEKMYRQDEPSYALFTAFTRAAAAYSAQNKA